MPFTKIEKKGLNACWIQESLTEGKLSVHISEVPAGERAHPPHTHAGVEAFYLLEGNATLELENETQPVAPNEAIILNAEELHGLVNSGDKPMRYMVIIAR